MIHGEAQSFFNPAGVSGLILPPLFPITVKFYSLITYYVSKSDKQSSLWQKSRD